MNRRITNFRLLPQDGNLDEISKSRFIVILTRIYKVFAKLIHQRISDNLFCQ